MQVTLNGQIRSLKFNQLALEVFTKHTDYETTQGDLYACIYAGLKGQSYVTREAVEYTFEQVCDWCDEAEQSELVKAYNEFTETNQFKVWFARFEELLRTKLQEADKKKETIKRPAKKTKLSGSKSTSSR